MVIQEAEDTSDQAVQEGSNKSAVGMCYDACSILRHLETPLGRKWRDLSIQSFWNCMIRRSGRSSADGDYIFDNAVLLISALPTRWCMAQHVHSARSEVL